MEEIIMEFLHPNVSSKIIDKSIGFLSAQGVTQLFVAFTSDTGEDNKVKVITSPTEWIFNYGNPNMKKHGQAAYNAMNWLNSAGGVYALRVMPDNAGFSHALVNIQTKESTKSVLNSNGDIVSFPDVTLRTAITYTGVNNISTEALETELSKDHPDTVDGFKNHVLFGVFPKGRGQAYDNLGFRITLTDNFDETYNFRLYNFEVTETAENGSTSVIEGPFLVSMSPDAVSKSNESMFIKYVVEKYSSYFNVLFNETEYDALGEIINPDVSPDKLDFLFGQTREVAGVKETFFSTVTEKDEDVHVRLHKYNVSGTPVVLGGVTVLNIVDADSSIESSILSVDNTLRNYMYALKLAAVTNMRVALSRAKALTYDALMLDIYDSTGPSGTLHDAYVEVGNTYSAFASAETTYNTTPVSANLTALKTAASEFKLAVDAYKPIAYTALDYARAIQEDSTTLAVMVSLYSVEAKQNLMNVKLSKLAGETAKIVDEETSLGLASSNSDADKLTAIFNTLSVASDVISLVTAYNESGEAEGNAALSTATTSYNTALSAYNTASDSNVLPSDVPALVLTAYNNALTLLDDVKVAIDLIGLEIRLATHKDVKISVDAVQSDLVSAMETSILMVDNASTTELKQALYDAVAVAINGAIADSNEAKINTYALLLHNFNSFAPFSMGNDGDLAETNLSRATTIDNLLIKAYKGLIDAEITDKNLYPIDLLLDANYSDEVKNAIVTFSTEIRPDVPAYLDTGFQANPQQSLDFRKNVLQVSNFRVGIFTQDFIVYDEFTGQDVKVTGTYYLASKIPTLDDQFGIQYPIAGPNRGTISGYKRISYNPTAAWKEQLYKKQVNYFEVTPRATMIGTNLTSQNVVSALSNLNNVRVLLRIQREVENLSKQYQFEFNDTETIESFQFNLNGYLNQWVQNRACDSISGNVYASQYDRQNKIVRVKIEMTFNSIIERVFIDLIVNR
jgi:hypothetical protein